MFQIAICSKVCKSIAFTMLAAGLTAAQALAPAGPKRPASVPAEFVVTPYGYFHPSCVAQLGNGDEVRKDEKMIKHKDGSFDSVHACAFSHFDNKGVVVSDKEASSVSVSQGTKQPTISHAWVEYASATTTSSYGELSAEWTVPPAPSVNNGQTVYLFPGMEDYSDVVTIIQPVLGWNSDYASAWGIASWNCCVSGTVFEATPARVNPGDTILGYMFDTCASGTKSCASWDIVTYDLTNGKYSELLNTSSFGQTFNWAFAGALEVYGIQQCGNYPPNYDTSFHNIYLYFNNFKQITDPIWSVTNSSSGLTPQCSYGGSISSQINLDY